MSKIYYCLLLSFIFLFAGEGKSFAQQVNKKALEKANWYSAPREFQIIDDRPVVKDFREGPEQAQTVNIPGGGGPGAGAGGGGAGGTIPAGGMHFGQPSVRTLQNNLPKSSFGSNIPVRGLSAGASSLPGAGLKSYMGGSKAPAAGSLPSGRSSSYVPRRNTVTTVKGPRSAAAPLVKSYGGYGTAPTTPTSSNSQELKVRGKLLHNK